MRVRVRARVRVRVRVRVRSRALARGGDERAGELLLLHRVHVSEDHPAELGGVDGDTRIGLCRAKRGEDLSWQPADCELRADVLAHVGEAGVVAWGGGEHHGLLTVGRHQCPVWPKSRDEGGRLAASKHLALGVGQEELQLRWTPSCSEVVPRRRCDIRYFGEIRWFNTGDPK